MSSILSRGVAMGTFSPFQLPGGPQDYLYAPGGWPANFFNFGYTNTGYIRLWASWMWMEPAGPTTPHADQTDMGPYGWPGMTPAAYMAAIDAQVGWAKLNGLHVILTLHEYPRWANGTAGLPANYETNPPSRFGKEFSMRPPDDVHWTSQTDYSWWSRIAYYLMQRYHPYNQANNGAFITFFEVCNEPNGAWWPQRNSSGQIVSARRAAEMSFTARKLAATMGGFPFMCGPAVADNGDTTQPDELTPYHTFTTEYVRQLAILGAGRTDRFAFSAHNYGDITRDTPTGQTRIAHMRSLLRTGGFGGWPYADPNDPHILITEGGAPLAVVRRLYPAEDSLLKQAALIARNHQRMHLLADGAGVDLMMNYLFYSDPFFDSGLLDHPDTGGAARPAYWTWRCLAPPASGC